MGSDPLTTKKPVKRFNLPNSPGSAPTQLVTLPVPSSLSSLFPLHPSALPPPPAADFAAGNRNFGGISPDSDRYVADPAAGKARRHTVASRPDFAVLPARNRYFCPDFGAGSGKERYERLFCDGDAC